MLETKEEILNKREQEYFVGEVYGDFAYKTNEVYIAMEEYAIQQVVDFTNWTLTQDCRYTCTDENSWKHEDYSIQNRIPTITTAELYQIYLKFIADGK